MSAVSAAAPSARARFEHWLPRLVLAPSFVLSFLFIYGLIAWNGYLSVSASRLLPNYEFVGLEQYGILFESERWWVALKNLAIFGSLFIGGAMAVGLLLAILLDQKIRAEGLLRTVYLYPMALSFIVTGTAWKWFLDPGIGLQAVVRSWGWESFTFEWIKDSDMAIYTIVIAAVWQTSGFVMAMFLAGLRGIDNEILKAAQIDGASNWQLYRRIVIPMLRPAFLSAFVILFHLAIKSYDLVVALTGGGPGRATELPATFMYSYTFTRNQMGIGAASAVIMLMSIAAIMVPFIWSELREKK